MSGWIAKLKRNSFSIRRTVSLYRVVGVMIFFFIPQLIRAAVPASRAEIEWLKEGWRAESLKAENTVSARQWTRNMVSKKVWMQGLLDNAAELGGSLSISPDGFIYFLTSSDEDHPFSSVSVYRWLPGWQEPRKFAAGLRKPLPIVFDAFGNPFVLDAGLGDSGEGRWLHLIENADYGWRGDFQADEDLSDKIFIENHRGDASSISSLRYVMPPLSVMPHKVVDVIAGTDTGWSVDLPQVFFMVSEKDGIHQLESLSSQRAGISFTLKRNFALARSGIPLFLEHGNESGLILIQDAKYEVETDQRVGHRFYDPRSEHTPESFRTRQFLETDPISQTTSALIQWLDHADRRIRMMAQFALVDRGNEALKASIQRAKNPFQTIGRLHAFWAMRLMLHLQPERSESLTLETWEKSFLADPNSIARSVALEIYTMLEGPHRERLLIEALNDGDAVVRSQAVRLLGSSASVDSKKTVLDWMVQTENQEYALQHAGMTALSTLMSTDELVNLTTHTDAGVRMAALLGLRRKKHAGVQKFLGDADPLITLEAAHAILDEPIPAALPSLAGLHATRTDWLSAFTLRDQRLLEGRSVESMLLCVYRANAILQQTRHVQAMAEAVESRETGERIRQRLSEWLLDWLRVKATKVGVWDESLEEFWKNRAESWMRADLEMQRRVMLDVIRFREWKHHATLVERIFRAYNERHEIRALALKTLVDWRVTGLSMLIREALMSNSALLRKEAVLIQAELNPADEVAAWVRWLESGSLDERRKALQSLGPSRDRRVDSVLLFWLEEALEERIWPELIQDLIEAAQQRTPPVIQKKLEALRSITEK